LSEWSFQRKLTSGLILICLLAIVTSVGALFASRVLISSLSQADGGAAQTLAEAKAIQLAGVRNIAISHACLLTGGARFVRMAQAGSTLVHDQSQLLRARLLEPAGRALLDSVLAAEAAHQDAFMRALIESGRPSGGAARPSFPQPVLAQSERLDQALTALVDHFEAIRLNSLASSRLGVHRAETMLVVITIMSVVVLAPLCLLLLLGLNRSYRKQSIARTRAEVGQAAAKATLTDVEAASHVKDEFLATVSHELRNPLAPILTWTQLLRGGTLDAEKTQRALEVIERNVLSQAQLIDDLVDISRVVSGKFRLDVRPIDLAPLIRVAADSQGPASDAKHIRLQLVLDDRGGMISGDSERIQQVMWNLISNAIKFTPKGGRVHVVLQRAESHMTIEVSDTGIGIAPEFLPHVFEPFRQATGGSMRRHGGLGLGLSIVRHIVEQHGGEISVQSAGLNLGSKFTVQFPVLATTPTASEPVRRHPVARDSLVVARLGRLDGLRVLVVDDEQNSSEALSVLFNSCGADARAAGSAPEALTLFETWQPDILVSDIAMPGEDGYSLIRKVRLRSPQRGGNTPAVALTAYAKIEDRVSILGAGFQMYLSKPADPTELVAVISRLARDREPIPPATAA
jgi:signal transduction histidine kinase/ActR/RegA family two-component response regulator